MKIKSIYILDLIIIIALTFIMPGTMYELGIYNTKLIVLGTLICFWFYIYVYRDNNPYKKDYSKLISVVENNFDLLEEIQLLHLIFFNHIKTKDKYISTLTMDSNFCFTIKLFYQQKQTIEQIKKDIIQVRIDYTSIICDYIDYYKTIVDFEFISIEDFNCIIKDYKNFFNKKDDYFFKENFIFLQYSEMFLEKIRALQKIKNKDKEKENYKKISCIKEMSAISALFQSNIRAKFLYCIIEYPCYQAKYLYTDNEIKLVDE